MAREGWKSISLPEILVRKIDAQVERGTYGSRAEFVKDAVRRLLETVANPREA